MVPSSDVAKSMLEKTGLSVNMDFAAVDLYNYNARMLLCKVHWRIIHSLSRVMRVNATVYVLDSTLREIIDF
jgi:hypothetical protein